MSNEISISVYLPIKRLLKIFFYLPRTAADCRLSNGTLKFYDIRIEYLNIVLRRNAHHINVLRQLVVTKYIIQTR